MQRPWCWDVTKRVVGCCRTDPWKPLGREPRQARSRAGRRAAWRHRSVCCARMRGFNARACPGRGRDEADRRSGLRRTRFRLAGPIEPETRGEPFGSRHRMKANAPRAPRRDKHCDPWRTVQPRRTRSSRKSSDRIEWLPSPSTAALSERTARRAMGHASAACTDVAGPSATTASAARPTKFRSVARLSMLIVLPLLVRTDDALASRRMARVGRIVWPRAPLRVALRSRPLRSSADPRAVEFAR